MVVNCAFFELKGANYSERLGEKESERRERERERDGWYGWLGG